MNIRLDQSSEQLVEQQLRTGRYRSPEEIVARALQALTDSECAQPALEGHAVDEMLAFARKYGFSLGSELRIRDLLHDSHKY